MKDSNDYACLEFPFLLDGRTHLLCKLKRIVSSRQVPRQIKKFQLDHLPRPNYSEKPMIHHNFLLGAEDKVRHIQQVGTTWSAAVVE